MAARGSLDNNELATALGWLLLGYVLVNYMRSQSATDPGGPTFDGTAPNAGLLTDGLDLIDPMQVSADGQAFIKQNEGLTLTKTPDAGGYEIGWGHFVQPGENIPGTITRAYAEQLFAGDLADAEAAINGSVTVPLSQNQFDALADWAFNVGAAAVAGSTLVRLLNQGDYAGAAEQFAVWDKSGGQTNAALQQRRAAEQGMFTG